MKVKFAPNLFVEVIELNRLQQSLDTQGWRQNLLENTELFGLIKNPKSDPSFQNGQVSQDTSVGGNLTVKISPLYAIDVAGNLIFQKQINNYVIPNDGNWHWIKVSYQASPIENGTFSIDSQGNLVGDPSATLTQIFRGQPNFPTRIQFVNSTNNLLQYDVLQIIDDQHAIIQSPALNTSGLSAFTAETDLQIKVVGTFTPGVSVPSGDQFPFQYDSCILSLVTEVGVPNSRPPYVVDSEFYLARVQVQGSNLVIQDKRINYWETKGSNRSLLTTRSASPLVGIEDVKWNSNFTPSDKNIVELAWGFRSGNWGVNSNQNILTLNGGIGGRFTAISSFTNGDFDGWRVYTQKNGLYSKILSSTKVGSSINLVLDILDVDNYSPDGGTTLDSASGYYILVVPDCDEVDILFTPNPGDNRSYMQKMFTFPVNTMVAKCEVTVYNTPTVLYNVQYRYKSFKEFTGFQAIPSSTTGYATEISYDANGNPTGSPVYFPYTTDPVLGFIQLTIAPWAYTIFRNQVYLGDYLGVNVNNTVPTSNLFNWIVGTDKHYQIFTGNLTLSNSSPLRINLATNGAVNGNEFRIHFNCSSLNLNGQNIIISQGPTGGPYTTLRTLLQADIYMMSNIDGGIVLDFSFNGTSWVFYQNYELGRPGEIITLDGVITSLFDATTKLGKVKGLFGYALCDGTVGGVPDLRDKFIVGAGDTYNVGVTGGAASVELTINNLPPHKHKAISWAIQFHTGTDPESESSLAEQMAESAGGSSAEGINGQRALGDTSTQVHNAGGYGSNFNAYNTGDGTSNVNGTDQLQPTPDAVPTLPPYYALIYAKKLF